MNELFIKIFQMLIKVNEYLSKTSNDDKFKITNEFRIRSLKLGLRTIKNYPTEITNVSQLNNIQGIGKGIKDRIKEVLDTKKLKELEEICKTIDCENLNKTSLNEDLLSIVGVGESLVKKVISEYKITSVKDFIELVKTNKLKVSKTVELGIKYYNKLKFNIPRQEITKTLDFLTTKINQVDDSIIIHALANDKGFIIIE